MKDRIVKIRPTFQIIVTFKNNTIIEKKCKGVKEVKKFKDSFNKNTIKYIRCL